MFSIEPLIIFATEPMSAWLYECPRDPKLWNAELLPRQYGSRLLPNILLAAALALQPPSPERAGQSKLASAQSSRPLESELTSADAE